MSVRAHPQSSVTVSMWGLPATDLQVQYSLEDLGGLHVPGVGWELRKDFIMKQ